MKEGTSKPANVVGSRSKTPGPPGHVALHGLLDTLRTLSSYEDEVCTLLHEMERKGKLDARSRRILGSLLEALPCDCLVNEMAALRRMLG